MTLTYRTIEVAGFTNKNAIALWDGRKVDTFTDIDVENFDFGSDIEKELENCRQWLKNQSEKEGWVTMPTPYISSHEIEVED